MVGQSKRRPPSIYGTTRMWEFKTLLEINKKLAAILDLDALLQTAADAVRELFQAKVAGIILVDETDYHQICHFKTAGQSLASQFPLDHPIFQFPYKKGHSIRTNPVSEAPAVLGPTLGAPLIAEVRTLGSIFVANAPGGPTFSLHQQRILETLATQVARTVKTTLTRDQQARQTILEERERISHTLHDSVAQNLFLLKLEIERLEKVLHPLSPNEAEPLHQMRVLTNNSLKNLRSAIYSLSDSLFRYQRISVTLKHMTEEFQRTSCIPTELVIHGDDTSLTAEVNLTIAKIVEEALNNIRKHSHSPYAAVSIIIEAGCAIVAVQDGGVGLPNGTLDYHGYGLRSLKSLIDRSSGTLQVLSNDDGGTTVRAYLPYRSTT